MPVQIDPVLLETLGTLLAAVLTVMVLSYILGDNALFRIATYLFVGVASGYAAAVALAGGPAAAPARPLPSPPPRPDRGGRSGGGRRSHHGHARPADVGRHGVPQSVRHRAADRRDGN